MEGEQKTAKFFDEAFIKSLQDVRFPQKADMIKKKLAELAEFCSCDLHTEEYSLWNVCVALRRCSKLLGSIKKQHQFSFEVPDIFEVPEKYRKSRCDLDGQTPSLRYNIGEDGMSKIHDSLSALHECTTAFAEEEKKKEEES